MAAKALDIRHRGKRQVFGKGKMLAIFPLEQSQLDFQFAVSMDRQR